MIKFKNTEEKYIDEAVNLALKEYEEECAKCPHLMKVNFQDELNTIVEEVFQEKYGKVAMENDRIIGYLAFKGPWDGFFGEVKGVFSPLGGSAFTGEDRGRLASMLFQQLGNDMVKDGVCSYALSRYAHDEEVGRALVLNGFGIRCSDAIMLLKNRKIVNTLDTKLVFKELNGEEKYQIKNMRRGLVRHLCSAPTFFPTHIESFNEWFERENVRVFVAKEGSTIMGYMALNKEAETFISEADRIYNICGAFIDEKYRSRGIAQQLLEYICRVCEKDGMEYLGVDCETLNPTALRFWGKYFDNYTYSYARRIDERVVGYTSYLNKLWGCL